MDPARHGVVLGWRSGKEAATRPGGTSPRPRMLIVAPPPRWKSGEVQGKLTLEVLVPAAFTVDTNASLSADVFRTQKRGYGCGSTCQPMGAMKPPGRGPGGVGVFFGEAASGEEGIEADPVG